MESDFRILLLLIPFVALLIASIVVLGRAHRRPSRESATRAVFRGLGLALAAALIGLAGMWLPADAQLSGRIGVTITVIMMLSLFVMLARRQLARADTAE